MDKKKIAFFIQTHKPIGGSQVLFLNLATYISKNYKEYQCYYINYKNKTVEEIYGGADIIFYDINECDYKELEDAIFFAPFNYVFYLLSKIRKLKKARVCLYFYHPEIMDWLSMQILERKVNFEGLMKAISKNNGYCFMDSSNYFSIERLYDYKFEKKYVPVTLSDNLDSYKKISGCSDDCLRIGWLGRLDRDKIYSVKNIIDNLSEVNCNKNIDFYIIGDGNSKSLIQYASYSPKIRFIFASYLYGEERNDFIRKNIDLMVAMGISAIDAAVLGVPTVLPIVSPVKFNDNKFIYLYNTEEYSLGWNINDLKKSNCKYTTIEKILEDIYEKDGKETIGQKCRQFALEEFSLKNGTDMFIKVIEESTLTVSQCMRVRLIRRQLLRQNLYRFLRGRKDFESFHEFNARVKRINLENKIINKIKRIKKELNKTMKKNNL